MRTRLTNFTSDLIIHSIPAHEAPLHEAISHHILESSKVRLDRSKLLELGERWQPLELSRTTNIVEESVGELENMVVYGSGGNLD
jgi:hypothetical protein